MIMTEIVYFHSVSSTTVARHSEACGPRDLLNLPGLLLYIDRIISALQRADSKWTKIMSSTCSVTITTFVLYNIIDYTTSQLTKLQIN